MDPEELLPLPQGDGEQVQASHPPPVTHERTALRLSGGNLLIIIYIAVDIYIYINGTGFYCLIYSTMYTHMYGMYTHLYVNILNIYTIY